MKNALAPWVRISTNIRQNKREDSNSWFPGGCIPNLTMISAAARRVQKGRTYTRRAAVRNCHWCLEILLQPFKDMQRDQPTMFFRRGDQIMYRCIACPLSAVFGDNKSHDTLACRMADYASPFSTMSYQVCPEFSLRPCLSPYQL
jgi:hypothetical protein